MWIMLNDRPFNICEITGISGLITIDSQFLFKNREALMFNHVDSIPENYLPEECRGRHLGELQKEIENNNTIYGYFFCINYQRGTKYSKVYSTKEAAQTALEHLLSEINEVYNTLVKVEI